MSAAGQQPGRRDVHDETEAGDGDGFREPDRHRRQEARDRLVANQDSDHREDDRRREPGEVAQLPGPEGEPRVVGMPARVAVGNRRQQHGPGMRTHMQAVRDQGDGAKQCAADDLQHHHGAAQDDDRPGAALRMLVPLAQEDVAVDGREVRHHGLGGKLVHGRGPHFR